MVWSLGWFKSLGFKFSSGFVCGDGTEQLEPPNGGPDRVPVIFGF